MKVEDAIHTLEDTLRVAVKKGWLKSNYASEIDFYPLKGRIDMNDDLSDKELEILDATPCEVPVIKEVFLLCCYCNLTHEEAFALKWSNITTTPEGRMRVDIYRPKTSTRSTFLIPVKAERYLPKRTTDDDFIFKPLSTETKDINDAFRIWTRSSILERRITFTRYKATYMRIYAERRYKSCNGR
jgi:hypothetical protein